MLCLTIFSGRLGAQPTITAVLNAFSLDGRLAPAALAEVRGPGIAPDTPVDGAPAGILVTVGGRPAPIFSTDLQSLRIQIPAELGTGPAAVVVRDAQGRSSAPFGVQLAAFAPAIRPSTAVVFGPAAPSASVAAFLRQNGTEGNIFSNPANPGEVVAIACTGLGPTNPPLLTGKAGPVDPPQYTVERPRVTIGGREAAVVYSVASPFYPGFYQVNFVIPGDLAPGIHPLVIQIGGASSSSQALVLPVAITGLLLTQTGFTIFSPVRAPGAPLPIPRFVPRLNIINSTTSPLMQFSTSASTLPGAATNWLSVAPANGVVTPGVPGTLFVLADSAGLAAGTYYGLIRVDSPEAPNSPQFVTVVLVVGDTSPAASLTASAAGLIFVTEAGRTPAAQALQVANTLSTATTFTITPSFAADPAWFTVTPSSGTAAPGQSLSVTVQPLASSFLLGVPGTYRGSLTINSSANNNRRVIDLLLVVTPPRFAPPAAGGVSQLGCTPKRLLPVFTLLGSSFNVPAAWPTPLEVTAVDECGNPLLSGAVTVAFSNGDQLMALSPVGDGRWSGTWAPGNARNPSLTLTATARSYAPPLEGTATISGSLQGNEGVPVINPGGVVSAASFRGAVPAPGELISIFGQKLADGVEAAKNLPLPAELQGATFAIGARPLPLVFTSEGQVNAVLPYDVPPGTVQQLIARHGNRLSLPVPVAVSGAQPGIFTVDGSGEGQGSIYVYPTAQTGFLANAAHPAHAGDVIVLYAGGLGPVDPPVPNGAAAPLSPLHPTTAPVTLTVGGQSAKIDFAGLTPGFVGLYQVNAKVPPGIAPNATAPVVVTSGPFSSPPVTMAVQ